MHKPCTGRAQPVHRECTAFVVNRANGGKSQKSLKARRSAGDADSGVSEFCYNVGAKRERVTMSGFVSFRSMVDPSDCDFLGHMNVSRYFTACSDGICAIQSELGLTAQDMRSGRRMSFAVVNAQSDFLMELLAGDAIFLETGIEEIGGKSLTFRHTLKRAPANETAFTTRFKCVLLSLESRRAVEVPEDIHQNTQAFMVQAS